MVVLTAETCWALNEYWMNNKISGIKLVFSLLNYKDDARSHKHKIAQVVKKFPEFMWSEDSLSWFKRPLVAPCPESVQSNNHKKPIVKRGQLIPFQHVQKYIPTCLSLERFQLQSYSSNSNDFQESFWNKVDSLRYAAFKPNSPFQTVSTALSICSGSHHPSLFSFGILQ